MKQSKQFIVQDWTGQNLQFYGVSDSFENAWDKVYINFEHLSGDDFDEQMGEFYVEEISVSE